MASNPGGSPPSLTVERAIFDGIIVSTVAYGALSMLCVQLLQVLVSRPTRGRLYWFIVGYACVLYPLATISAGGRLKYMELAYIDHRSDPGGPSQYFYLHTFQPVSMASQVCTTLVPWVCDLMLLYRVLVVWNYNWWIAAFPIVTYFARLALSVPMLIAQVRPQDDSWAPKSVPYSTAFYTLCLAMNIYASIIIGARIYTMRRQVEMIMGKLHATFYTNYITIIEESGAFFTLWSLVYVILLFQKSPKGETFHLGYTQVLSITRMLVVLRMAQDRAWSKELVMAAHLGVMDWHVSSTHSVPFPSDIPITSSLPRKYQQKTESIES